MPRSKSQDLDHAHDRGLHPVITRLPHHIRWSQGVLVIVLLSVAGAAQGAVVSSGMSYSVSPGDVVTYAWTMTREARDPFAAQELSASDTRIFRANGICTLIGAEPPSQLRGVSRVFIDLDSESDLSQWLGDHWGETYAALINNRTGRMLEASHVGPADSIEVAPGTGPERLRARAVFSPSELPTRLSEEARIKRVVDVLFPNIGSAAAPGLSWLDNFPHLDVEERPRSDKVVSQRRVTSRTPFPIAFDFQESVVVVTPGLISSEWTAVGGWSLAESGPAMDHSRCRGSFRVVGLSQAAVGSFEYTVDRVE
jgi:hypothetical protein